MNKTAILIPYRGREYHLTFFLNNARPLLQKLMNVRIVIIEQARKNQHFNRGKLLNIGYEMNQECDMFLTHDVDIIPLEHTIKQYYMKDISENEVMGIYTSACGTLGGIIKFAGQTFKDVNGFSNNFWGWGCEDKDLQNRMEFGKKKISKNILNKDLDRGKYFQFLHHKPSAKVMPFHHFVYNKWNALSQDLKMKWIKASGLNNLKFNVLKDIMLMKGVRLITVDI